MVCSTLSCCYCLHIPVTFCVPFQCLKESYVKATGTGIGHDLQAVEFQINTNKLSPQVCCFAFFGGGFRFAWPFYAIFVLFLFFLKAISFWKQYWSYLPTCSSWRLVQWNPALRPPCYYDHFFWPEECASVSYSYFKNPFNTTIPLIQPQFYGPTTAVLM